MCCVDVTGGMASALEERRNKEVYMDIWVVAYEYGDIDGIVCVTEKIKVAAFMAILDCENGFGGDYFIQHWQDGALMSKIPIEFIWHDDGDSINAEETLKNIKMK